MNLSTILTIVALVIVFILPFIIINIKNKKEEKKFLQILLDYASQNKLGIAHYEIIGEQIIAFSELFNFIMFLKRQVNGEKFIQVDLDKIEQCYINKSMRRSVDGNYSTTEKIELSFKFKDKNKKEISFELYNLEYDSMALKGELQLAEKWHSLIKDRIDRRVL